MEVGGITADVYWIEQLKEGNNSALSYFFDLHYTSLCYFATRLTQDEAEAKDIVAESFVKVWEKRLDFPTATNIKAFLYIRCRNECLNYLRSLQRKTAAQQLYFDQLTLNDDGILHEIIQAEFLNILDEEINLLPHKCRQVFKLLYYEGKRTDEVAQQLDISVKTVRSHKGNAIELLKTAFLKKDISGPLVLALLLYLDRS
ncbi:RNA polymerase ECF-type sigma factor [Pedobacter sp. BAL39]|uniref:RNA polymerase sigma factor n=1 Tax=Pedobacter sp. BAL39 TaxID=391596 RepID=UPI0001559899|nr:RNA polymerase sigma-70 factor [Pedobacter sp. BAL39]EDM38910.1 RNA polymerase ECF-type sigma factor [Pedobacter sp. BAL39]